MDIGNISSSMTSGLSGGQSINQATQSAEQARDDSFEKHLTAAVKSKDDKELKSACQQFEAVMLNMVFKQMKATVAKSDLIKQDEGTEIFQSMLDDSLMEQASKTGSFGLAESIYKQLSRQTKAGGNIDDKGKTAAAGE